MATRKKRLKDDMLIALTGDLQFDEYVRWSKPTGRGTTTRLEDFLRCFSWVVKESHAKGCKALFVLGDVFDSRTTISIPVLDCVCKAFKDAADYLDVYVMAGNHDSYLRDTAMTSISVLDGYARVVTEPTVIEMAGARIGLVPWRDSIKGITSDVNCMVEQEADYLFAHQLLKGVVTGSAGVPLSALRQTCFKRVLLGDVHEPRNISEKIQYLGAPLQINYGDANSARGFWTLGLGTGELEFIENIESPKFHILTGHEGEVDGVRGCDFVRVKLDDDVKASSVIQEVRDRLPNAWVEGVVEDVVIDDDAPRMNLSVSDTQHEAIKKYAEFQGVGGNELLVTTGLNLLVEAQTQE